MARKPGQSHLNQRVSRAAGKLDDHKLLLGAIVMVAGAFLAYVAFVSTTGPPFQSRYQIKVQVPGDSPPLRIGQAVRIGGQLAGLISGIEPDREQRRGRWRRRTSPSQQFRPIRQRRRRPGHACTRSSTRPISSCDPGTSDRGPDAERRHLPQAGVTSGTDLLEVVSSSTRRRARS